MERQTKVTEGIQTDFSNKMTYSDYLHLDQLLSSQEPKSDHHDEMLFIIIHQATELWMKLIIHEFEAAVEAIQNRELSKSFKMLARVSKIQSQIIQSWDVLTTLTPSEYLLFRNKLGQASGFQSFQYRMIEFYLGNKSSHILEIYQHDSGLHNKLTRLLNQPSLYDVSIQELYKAGFPISDYIIKRDWNEPYKGDSTVKDAWLSVYQNVDKYWDLYELAEKLVDIEDWFQQWRFRHMKTVERIIGFKKGTGGSSGVNYLRKVVEQRYFPELWDVRTELT